MIQKNDALSCKVNWANCCLFFCLHSLILIGLIGIFKNIQIIIVGFAFNVIIWNVLVKKKEVICLTLIGIFIEMLFMCVMYYGYMHQYGAPYFLGGSDDLFYDTWGVNIASTDIWNITEVKDNLPAQGHNVSGYIWFESLLVRACYLFGGFHVIIFRMANIYLWIIIANLAYRYVKSKVHYSERASLLTLGFILLFPAPLYVIVHNFRDIHVTFVVFLVFYLSSYIKNNTLEKKVIYIAFILALGYYAYFLRDVALMYIIFVIFINAFIGEKGLNYKALLFVIIVCLIGQLLDIWNKIADYQSAYLYFQQDLIVNSIFQHPLLPFGIIERIIVGLNTPGANGIFKLFTGVNNFTDAVKVFLGFGTLLQLFILPYLFMGLRKLNTMAITFIMLFFSVILTTFLNRHLICIYPFMFMVLSEPLLEASKPIRIIGIVVSLAIGGWMLISFT